MATVEGIYLGGETLYFGDAYKLSATPKVVYAEAGQSVSFSVSDGVKGDNVTYQWYYSPTGKSWATTSQSGSKTNTITISASSVRDGYLYRCKITINGTSITSEPAKFILLS